jgi:hypothetical protein
MVSRIAQYTRLECTVLNGATSFSDGTAIIVVRTNSSRSVAKGIAAIRNAAACQAPVIVIAGFDDEIGNAYLNEAKRCGVPGECILLVRDGLVVDAAGNTLGKALHDTAIGIRTALTVARRSLKHNLLPEVGASEIQAPDLVEPAPPGGGPGAGEAPAEPAPRETTAAQAAATPVSKHPAPEAAAQAAAVATPPAPSLGGTRQQATDGGAPEVTAPAPKIVAPPSPSPAHAVFPWYGFVEQAKHIVAVFGVKSGVGASMVAACLTGRMTEQNSLYLEVAPNASGFTYYGRSPAEAAQSGKYAFCDKDALIGSLRPVTVLVADVCFPEALDLVYQKASYVVVVTDGSTLGFEKTKNWINGGWRVDSLVVNKVLYGSGYPPEVYIREFNIPDVIGIPGGNEEKVAIHVAQRKGYLPFGKSSDLDDAIKTLVNRILASLK